MRTALVMDNRFFVISLIVIGCLVLTGSLLFPLIGMFYVIGGVKTR